MNKIFQEMAPTMHIYTVNEIFSEIDEDGDGRVSYRDFERMMKQKL